MLALRRIGRLFTATHAGTLVDAAVAMTDGVVSWVGPEAALSGWLRESSAPGDVEVVVDCAGALVTPGLIDAHTHPLYAGNRFSEIAARSAGAGYLEIAAAGGGIGATVRATRGASPDALAEGLAARLKGWLAGGTTTLEAKTGYFLDEVGELGGVRMLAAAAGGPRLEVTFLAAHAVPPERAGDQGGYAASVASWCPAAREAGARHCDVFCDEGYFTLAETRQIAEAASAAGLLVRLHVDELARTGGAQLAAELGAVSADHLLCITSDDALALASAGVVATLAPATALSMGRRPPARALLDAGATIALGTDHNPGTCGTTSMSLIVGLAVTGLGLSVDEALMAATAGGAASVRRPDRGAVAPGMAADLVVWDADHEGAFAWSYGLTPRTVVLAGAVVA